jgi:hypothetical protein
MKGKQDQEACQRTFQFLHAQNKRQNKSHRKTPIKSAINSQIACDNFFNLKFCMHFLDDAEENA